MTNKWKTNGLRLIFPNEYIYEKMTDEQIILLTKMRVQSPRESKILRVFLLFSSCVCVAICFHVVVVIRNQTICKHSRAEFFSFTFFRIISFWFSDWTVNWRDRIYWNCHYLWFEFVICLFRIEFQIGTRRESKMERIGFLLLFFF